MLIDLGVCYTLLNVKTGIDESPVLSRKERKVILMDFVARYATYNSLSELTTVDDHYINVVADIFSLDEDQVEALHKVDEYLTEMIDDLLKTAGIIQTSNGVLSLETNGEFVRVAYLPIGLLVNMINVITPSIYKLNLPLTTSIQTDTVNELIHHLENNEVSTSNETLNVIRQYLQTLH